MEESSEHQHDDGDDMEVNGQAQEGHSGSVGPAAGRSPLLDDLSCPICMSQRRDTFVTNCGHTFCCSCLSTHLDARNTCPSCGQYLIRDHTYPNFLLSKVRRTRLIALPHACVTASYWLTGPRKQHTACSTACHLLIERACAWSYCTLPRIAIQKLTDLPPKHTHLSLGSSAIHAGMHVC